MEQEPAGQLGNGIALKGTGVSPGVVVGPVFLLVPRTDSVVVRDVAPEDVDLEICRLEEALIETRAQIRGIQKDLERRTRLGDASILDPHLMVLDDRTFLEEVVREIRDRRINAEAVVKAAADRYMDILASLDDVYLRERVVDVKDVARRIIQNLSPSAGASPKAVPSGHIIVAADLAPTETAAFRKETVSGFATDMGSSTSHTAVMARALEIPAVVALHDISERVATGDEILIDGNRGVLIIRPTPEQLEQYGRVVETRRTIQQELNTLQHQPAETRDGHRIVLSANIEGVQEVESVLQYGGEGVGLFRSEYIFLTRGAVVGEEEQAEVYSQVASRLAPAPVIIRTLDLGGDKFFADGTFAREANPFLGCRSIRLSLQYPDQFKVQLRAILRASRWGNVKIMYPMISSAEEVAQANRFLEEAKAELDVEGIPFQADLDVGVMVEIPCAALMSEVISRHVRFFSLGTNDLIQYTLAVDRVNDRVAYLYQPTHPAVLKLIHHTVQMGHRRGIWVGLCGEMAADPVLAPLLLGLGVDEMSVAPSAVPAVKDAVRSVEYSRACALAEKALGCETATEVLNLCRDLMRDVAPELLELV
jgi:phosphoenolpyruvate-protein phosphotransferase (PTS system enzyme I)